MRLHRAHRKLEQPAALGVSPHSLSQQAIRQNRHLRTFNATSLAASVTPLLTSRLPPTLCLSSFPAGFGAAVAIGNF
jgi:hypothetical protein